MSQIVKCRSVETNTGIFTEGQYYQANIINDGRLVQIMDNYGNAKNISYDTLRFTLGDGHKYVRFEWVNH